MTKFNEQFQPFSQISGNSLEDYFNNFRIHLVWNYTHNFFFLKLFMTLRNYPWHQLAVVLAVNFCSMVNSLFGTCFIDSSNLNVNAFIEYGHLQLQVLFYSALCLLFIYDLKILTWNLNACLTYSFHKSQSKFSTLISLLP